MARAREVAASVEGRTGDIEAFITNMNSISEQLEAVVAKADSAMSDVEKVAGQLGEADFKGTVSNINSLLEQVQNPDGTVGRLMNEGTLYDSLDSLISNIDSLVRKIEKNPRKYLKISVF